MSHYDVHDTCSVLTKMGTLCRNKRWSGHKYCRVHEKVNKKESKHSRSPYAIALGAGAVALGLGTAGYLASRATRRPVRPPPPETKITPVVRLPPRPSSRIKEAQGPEVEYGYDQKECGVRDESDQRESLTRTYWEEAKTQPIIRLRVGDRVRCYNLERLYERVRTAKEHGETPLDPESKLSIGTTQVAQLLDEYEVTRQLGEGVGYDPIQCHVSDESVQVEPYSRQSWKEAKTGPVVRLRLQGRIRCYNLKEVYEAVQRAKAKNEQVLVPDLALPLTRRQVDHVVREFQRLQVPELQHPEKESPPAIVEHEPRITVREETKPRLPKEVKTEEKTEQQREVEWLEEKKKGEAKRPLTFDGTLRVVDRDECERLLERYKRQPILVYSEYGMHWEKCQAPGCFYALVSQQLWDPQQKQQAEKRAYYLNLLKDEQVDGQPMVPRLYDAWICREDGPEFGTAYMLLERYDQDMDVRARERGDRHRPTLPKLFESGELRRMFRISVRLGQLGLVNTSLRPRSFLHRKRDGNVALLELGFAGVPAQARPVERKGIHKYDAVSIGSLELGSSCPPASSVIACRERTIDKLSCAEYLNILFLEMSLLKPGEQVYIQSRDRVYLFGGIFGFKRDTLLNPCKDYTDIAVSEVRSKNRLRTTSRLGDTELRLYRISDITPL